MARSSAQVINKNLDKNFSRKELSKAFYTTSRDELIEQKTKGNFLDPVFQIDKGARTDNPEIVKKASRIVQITQRSESLAKAVNFLIPRILKQSPILTSEYKFNHFMEIDGNQGIRIFGLSKKAITELVKNAKDIRIYNDRIYANKLERTSNKNTRVKGNITYITAHGVYDFFSRKIRGATFDGVIARVGRSDRYVIKNDPGHKTKNGERVVLPVIWLSIEATK